MGVDLDAPLRRFLETLASDAPTPGGGSAAALTGALAASLASMVARLTLGKKGYEGAEEEMERALAASEGIRERLEVLVVEDAAAFEGVAEAFRMGKETENDKVRRSEAIQRGLREAAEVPLETAELCVELLSGLLSLAERGNVHAVSDTGGAAHLAYAAFEAALLNVEINLASLRDDAFVAATRRRVGELRPQAAAHRDRAVRAVTERLG